MKGTEHFLTVFFLLYVLCRFVRKQNICLCLFMLLLSEKIYHLERESDNTFLCFCSRAAAVGYRAQPTKESWRKRMPL